MMSQDVLARAAMQTFLFPYPLDKPTVCLDVTSLVVCSYGYDNGKSEPTRCALIGGALGGRCRLQWTYRTLPSAARSTRSVLAAVSRPASPAAPGGFH